MTLHQKLLAGLVLLAFVGWLARPVRWEVDGLSMAPGLLPGDVVQSGWFPLVDRWRRPRRLERWTLAAPDGAIAVKRVWGLPGEEVGIVDGDVTVDGEVVVKPPRVLAEVALQVAPVSRSTTDGDVRFVLPDPVLDDVPFAPDERRVLVPVVDVGVAAVIEVDTDDGPVSVEIFVASRGVRMHVRKPGRHAVVAGRLDGAFVAAAWPLEPGAVTGSCLPPGGPDEWSVQSRWNPEEPVTSLAVHVVTPLARSKRATIVDGVSWRDVHHLVPATGTMQWRLNGDEAFVLGDYPGGSRDSRQWGSVGIEGFRTRLTAPSR